VRRARFSVPEAELDPVLDRFMHLLPRGARVRVEDGVASVEAVGITLPDLRALGIEDVAEDEVPADFQLRRGPGGVVIGGRLLIRSPEDPPREELIDVAIAWGGAGFGSGSHPTTRMCAELLLDVDPATGGVLDVGTGLGTLAIVAAALGFTPVTAVDRDATALAAAQANVERNGASIATQLLDAETDGLPYEPVVIVNAPPAVHGRVAHAAPLLTHTAIVSGFTTPEAPIVLEAYAAAGLAVADQRVDADGVWNAARLTR
jgi:ribosomal protein L11 methyltransferase